MKEFNRTGYIDSSFLTLKNLTSLLNIKCSFDYTKKLVINCDSYPRVNLEDLASIIRNDLHVNCNVCMQLIDFTFKKYSIFFLTPYEGAFIIFLEQQNNKLVFQHPYTGIIEMTNEQFTKDCKEVYLQIGETEVEENIINEPEDILQNETQDIDRYLSNNIATISNFLTKEECKHLVLYIESERNKQIEEDVLNKQDIVSKTNFSVYPDSEDSITKKITDKVIRHISAFNESKPVTIDSFIMIRYSEGQRNSLHYDILDEQKGNYIYSFIIYLNEDFIGGETFFPQLNYKVTPTTGSGLFFRNIDSNLKTIDCSVHAGLPIQENIKYTCNIWIK